jgi:HEAT repeat protein
MNEIIQQAMTAIYGADAQARTEAIAIVSENRYEPAAAVLSEILPDVDPGTRYLIVKALGNIAHEDGLSALFEALRYDDIWTRSAATGAIISIGTERAVKGLLDALRDENKAVRRAAAKAIGKIGIEQGADHPQYNDILHSLSVGLLDVDHGVRRFSAEALGRVQASDKVQELAVLLDDAVTEVRIAAFRALTSLNTPEAQAIVRRWSKGS